MMKAKKRDRILTGADFHPDLLEKLWPILEGGMVEFLANTTDVLRVKVIPMWESGDPVVKNSLDFELGLKRWQEAQVKMCGHYLIPESFRVGKGIAVECVISKKG